MASTHIKKIFGSTAFQFARCHWQTSYWLMKSSWRFRRLPTSKSQANSLPTILSTTEKEGEASAITWQYLVKSVGSGYFVPFSVLDKTLPLPIHDRWCGGNLFTHVVPSPCILDFLRTSRSSQKLKSWETQLNDAFCPSRTTHVHAPWRRLSHDPISLNPRATVGDMTPSVASSPS